MLGMWTVTWLLKPIVVTGHLLGGLATFSLLTWLAWATTPDAKLVQAVASEAQRQVIEAMGIPAIPLPTFDMARAERFKIALVSGLSKGLFKQGEVVLGMLGRRPASYPDTIMVVTMGADGESSIDTTNRHISAGEAPRMRSSASVRRSST
jgi:hypothetical protein